MPIKKYRCGDIMLVRVKEFQPDYLIPRSLAVNSVGQGREWAPCMFNED